MDYSRSLPNMLDRDSRMAHSRLARGGSSYRLLAVLAGACLMLASCNSVGRHATTSTTGAPRTAVPASTSRSVSTPADGPNAMAMVTKAGAQLWPSRVPLGNSNTYAVGGWGGDASNLLAESISVWTFPSHTALIAGLEADPPQPPFDNIMFVLGDKWFAQIAVGRAGPPPQDIVTRIGGKVKPLPLDLNSLS